MGIKDEITDPDRTIIFVRHGLEWWLIWEFRIKIAQPHIELNDNMIHKYDHIFFLIQKQGENIFYPGIILTEQNLKVSGLVKQIISLH
ncbi:MAG: hypothetical protein LC649_06195 [Bacteroidales bacterium]|nr:hypothetical protein [Bacteroidales bacterium]